MVAIIAGTGFLPIEACTSMLIAQKQFFVVSLFPEDNGTLLHDTVKDRAKLISINVYKVSAILDLLKKHHTTELLFIGKVDKQLLLKNAALDWLGIKLLASLIRRSDREIMERLLEFLAEHNIRVLSQAEVLKPLFIPAGVVTGRLTADIKKNIEVGLSYAQAIAQCDIGQTIIMKQEMIIAVEAIEGTDRCIARGIELCRDKIIVCKRARVDQNERFDLPTLGLNSLENIQRGQIEAIAWQSDQTFIVDKDSFIRRAQELNITLVAV